MHPEYQRVVNALTPVLSDLPPRVVGIDGWDGVGKTTLGRYLAWRFNVTLIETDLFLVPGSRPVRYRNAEIAAMVAARLERQRPVIVDGILLLDLLSRLQLRADFLIYVRTGQSRNDSSLAPILEVYDEKFVPSACADILVTLAGI